MAPRHDARLRKISANIDDIINQLIRLNLGKGETFLHSGNSSNQFDLVARHSCQNRYTAGIHSFWKSFQSSLTCTADQSDEGVTDSTCYISTEESDIAFDRNTCLGLQTRTHYLCNNSLENKLSVRNLLDGV